MLDGGDDGLRDPWQRWDSRLEEWLAAALQDGRHARDLVDWEFPTMALFEQYLEGVHERPESDVVKLLRRLLMESRSYGVDRFRLSALVAAIRGGHKELAVGMLRTESMRRLIRHAKDVKAPPPWEGNNWVIDLLPYFPKEALQALSAYELAHAQELPDGRLNGLAEAMAIIRTRWITGGQGDDKRNAIIGMTPREFEHLVEAMYFSPGYETELTAPSGDGGRDVIARLDAGPLQREVVIAECKRHVRPVGVAHVRNLHGVVYTEHANKGVIFTAGTLTRGARQLAAEYPRLELVAAEELIALCNEHLGMWLPRIDSIIAESKRRNAPSLPEVP